MIAVVWMCVCALLWASACFAAPAPGARASVAPPGISMTWNACPGGAGAATDLAYACASNTDNLSLICSAVLSTTVGSTIGAEVVVDIQHSAATLPDWWRFDGSGAALCRGGALGAAFDYAGGSACTDAWIGNGFGGIQGLTIGPPDHPQMNQARIKAVGAVTSDHAVTLDPGTTYGLIRLVISTFKTTGIDSCAGCSGTACLVFNSVWIRRIPGSGGDVYLTTPASAGSNWCTWQGTGADCSLVPTRRATWGQIKSLYR